MEYTTQSYDLLCRVEDSRNPLKSPTTLYLVPKPLSDSTTKPFENGVWRVSTSKLETTIVQRIPNCKRDAYILAKILLERSGKVSDRDGLGSCEYYIHTYLLKTVFLDELARVPEDKSWEGTDVVNRLLHIFDHLKQNIESGDVPSFFINEYNLLFGENSITERAARVWILDAILLFLSSINDKQPEESNPRDLERMLQSRRPECISSKEVTKLYHQDASKVTFP